MDQRIRLERKRNLKKKRSDLGRGRRQERRAVQQGQGPASAAWAAGGGGAGPTRTQAIRRSPIYTVAAGRESPVLACTSGTAPKRTSISVALRCTTGVTAGGAAKIS